MIRLFNFSLNGQRLIGVNYRNKNYIITKPNVGTTVDLAQEGVEYEDLKDFLEQYDGEIDFQTPSSNPSKIICVGLNYKDHADETGKKITETPTFFTRNKNSYVPHNNYIEKTKFSNKYDYEAELAVVIGKTAKNITSKETYDYIAGYSIFNDVTVRDFQAKTSQWFLGKNFDKAGSFGPYLISKKFLPRDAQGLKIKTWVNDEILQSSSTSEMIFKPSAIIEYLTKYLTLEKGDVIITGTPAGVGVAKNPRKYLKNNDVCKIEIDKIGILENIIKEV